MLSGFVDTLHSRQALSLAMLALLVFVLASLWLPANANVEKTIFLAPSDSPLPSDTGLDDLGLERLSPLAPALRTHLNASFPASDTPLGTESWYFLENLAAGQRYEVRICYLATVCMHALSRSSIN